MKYKLSITCIKEKKILATAILWEKDISFTTSQLLDYNIKKGYKSNVDFMGGNIFVINLEKNYEIEFEIQCKNSERQISIINIWAYFSKLSILSGMDKHFSLGRHLMIEKKY